MSADNMIYVQHRADGFWWVWMGFASEDNHIPPDDSTKFATRALALAYAGGWLRGEWVVEYGIVELEPECPFEQYEHHGAMVWVRSDLRGQHAEFCLCHRCQRFRPNEVGNCPIAQATYEHNVEHDLVTPVWECPEFEDSSEMRGKRERDS